MKFSKKILSQTVTQLCLAKGITNIVISPGSRNAPLTISFTEDSSFKNFSIIDERCAAFFALGMAQQLREPVALVCTSGSSLLNYYPAIAEAFYSDISLVIISADRPAHLIDVGDGQTIRQENVYANHILYSANCRDGDSFQSYNEAEINNALNLAIEQRGPVHINVPFDEPLYETVDSISITPKNIVPRFSSETFSPSIDLENFKKRWNSASRKMILVGVLPPDSVQQKYIDILAEDDSVIILTETTSNLHHPNFFPAIDQLIAPLSEEEQKELQPEILLTFGGLVVSKKIKALLRIFPPKTHYHVDGKKANDTFFALTAHFQTDIETFFETIDLQNTLLNSDFKPHWLTVQNHRLEEHAKYIDTIPFCDFKVFSRLFEALPTNIQLQLANSATVRYAQLFDLDKSFRVFCNRGTSGIDGSTTTAIGAAYVSELPTVFITGDLSFFYDSNALWNNYIPSNFKIIVVNNSGGGIFRILPGNNDSENFSTYFETNHQLTAESLCQMYGLTYLSANSEDSLENGMDKLFSDSEKPGLLEVFTPSKTNDRIVLDYFKFIA